MCTSLKIRAFITLLLAIIFASQSIGATTNPDYSDYFVPGFEEWDQLREDWIQEWVNFLSQSETPWIRVWGALRNISGQYPGPRDIRPEQLSEQLTAVNAVFLEVETDLYSLVALAHACETWGYKEKCREHKVYERIIGLDPDNVMAYMIPITVDRHPSYGSSKEAGANADTPEIQRLIIAASNLTEWELYADKAALEYFRANLDFVSEIPPPTEEQRQVPNYVLAFMNGESAPLYVSGGLDKVRVLCTYYEEAGLHELTKACTKLAAIFRENHFEDGYLMESLRVFRADPFDPEGLYLTRKASVFRKVSECLQTHWLKRKSLWPGINRATFENYIIDVSLHGRWEATRNASIAEYDSDPSLYSLDPRECESMLDLGSEEMGALLGDKDPLHNRLEYQKRILITEEYATHVTADERMMTEIEKLDTIEGVDDPLVAHLGSHGEPATPYLLEKLCSSRGMTSLSAAYAISSNPIDSTLFKLLELWVEGRSMGLPCESVAAMGSIMRQKESQFRKPETDDFASDYDALLNAIYCDVDENDEMVDEDLDSELPTLVVFSDQVTDTRAIDCEVRPLETRPNLNRFERRDWLDEKPYYFTLTVKILDLPEVAVQMPGFEATYGSRPTALADVYQGWGNGGTGQLWVKTEESWIKIQDTHSIAH